jgi:hypothetical protein
VDTSAVPAVTAPDVDFEPRWPNSLPDIDVVHEKGFLVGAIGIELCHGPKHALLDVKSLGRQPQDAR